MLRQGPTQSVNFSASPLVFFLLLLRAQGDVKPFDNFFIKPLIPIRRCYLPTKGFTSRETRLASLWGGKMSERRLKPRQGYLSITPKSQEPVEV